MIFTTQTPTHEGAYWWKLVEFCNPTLVHVDTSRGELLAYTVRHNGVTLESLGGLWCRLVAADECVPKEEVEKAWWEDREGDGCFAMWNNSRAKRVVEGME